MKGTAAEENKRIIISGHSVPAALQQSNAQHLQSGHRVCSYYCPHCSRPEWEHGLHRHDKKSSRQNCGNALFFEILCHIKNGGQIVARRYKVRPGAYIMQ